MKVVLTIFVVGGVVVSVACLLGYAYSRRLAALIARLDAPPKDADILVSEDALDCDEIFRRGGQNIGDEDFMLIKCPHCSHIYLFESECDTVYLNPNDLSQRMAVYPEPFVCVACGQNVQSLCGVAWPELAASEWAWAACPPTTGA